ncbi:acylglycerol lipase [Flavihumibacter solisilvae]|uniref:Acylglycerol lipase n=2 Tax=Flavihumibacter solisilvae TaxID=1349421 RepID=A0A0C1L720_9BACT|nr:acylglycerol lipase [Flavihumibacter solisilvae]
MQVKEKPKSGCFIGHKGLDIFYRNWKTDGMPKGIVIIVHGLNSHSGYYNNFALQLNKAQFGVFALDLPGRGLSEGERFYIGNYNDVVADINLLMDIVVSEYPAFPVFLFGHSAGGVFASVYAMIYQYKLAGLISESFAFQIPAPRFALATIKFLANVIPHTRLVKLNNEDFSRNKSVVDTMNNDPFLLGEKQPAKTMQQLLRAADDLKNGMNRISLPLLILHGTADRATSPEGSKYFMENVSSSDRELKLYEGFYHDLVNDRNNGVVIDDIISWLSERV